LRGGWQSSIRLELAKILLKAGDIVFGKMTLQKATDFYLTDPRIAMAKKNLKPDQNFLAYSWNSYEKNVHTMFKRRYNKELTIEQRWHITLAVFETCPYSIEFSLNDFLRGSARDVAMWSVGAMGRFIDLGFPENFPTKEVLYGFPHFPVFWYSIVNFEEI
jgi:hypothetical protein